jgi:hypothetical protein
MWRVIGVLCVFAGGEGALAQAPTLGERDPSDPGQVVPATTYQPVTSGLQSFRPVDPLPWGSQNEKVAPKSKTDEESPAARQ